MVAAAYERKPALQLSKTFPDITGRLRHPERGDPGRLTSRVRITNRIAIFSRLNA